MAEYRCHHDQAENAGQQDELISQALSWASVRLIMAV